MYKGFKTIYDGRIAKYIKDINKDITKRGKQLGLNDEQLKSVQLQVKDNGIYRFEEDLEMIPTQHLINMLQNGSISWFKKSCKGCRK